MQWYSLEESDVNPPPVEQMVKHLFDLFPSERENLYISAPVWTFARELEEVIKEEAWGLERLQEAMERLVWTSKTRPTVADVILSYMRVNYERARAES